MHGYVVRRQGEREPIYIGGDRLWVPDIYMAKIFYNREKAIRKAEKFSGEIVEVKLVMEVVE